MEITKDTYDAAYEFAAQHWPTHNRAQGIEWNQVTFGLLAAEGDSVTGAATAIVVGGAASLEQLVVAPSKVRCGIGRALVAAFESEARKMQCHVLELETAESQARPFYEKLGFKVVAEKPNSKFRQTWYLMQKNL